MIKMTTRDILPVVLDMTLCTFMDVYDILPVVLDMTLCTFMDVYDILPVVLDMTLYVYGCILLYIDVNSVACFIRSLFI